MDGKSQLVTQAFDAMRGSNLRQFSEAIEALNAQGQSIEPLVVHALSFDCDIGVRLGAACVLSHIGTPSPDVLAALQLAMTDSDDKVREVAGEAFAIVSERTQQRAA